jgi:hypothetical protein
MADKLKVTTKGLNFIGHCSCGLTHTFTKQNKLFYQEQKQIVPSYTCVNCSNEYSEFYVDYPKEKIKRNRKFLFSVLISCCLVLGIWVSSNVNEWKGEPTYFDTGNLNDMTDEQRDSYFKWLFEKENKD